MLPVDPIPFNPLAAVSGPAAQELRHSRERSDTGVIRLGGEDTGSFLHPQMMREDRGYVIAGLYQDVHMNVASGIYDQDGALLDRYWIHSGPLTSVSAPAPTVATAATPTSLAYPCPTSAAASW